MEKAGTKLYPADRLAEDTLRGIEKNKAILAIPGDSRRLWIMARVAPTFVIQQMTKRTEAMRKQLAAASA